MNTTKKARIVAKIKTFKNTDFSDCPELTDEQLAQMKPSHLRKKANDNSIKKKIRVRLDADVLDWLKSSDKDYQIRMNEILRKAMLRSGA